jgi:ATP-dependent helicase/nuclease subunit A
MSRRTNPTEQADIVPLADQNSRRVIREELDTNLLVEAGAGSGKTQMLAERMAAGVAKGVFSIERMAAVTFTRKAASELRGRFHLALEKIHSDLRERVAKGFSPAEVPDASARVEQALGNLERFFAGTIHSFCARLLRERPVESGVAPGFTELDEVQDEEVRNRAWRDFIGSARAVGDPDMLALLDTGLRLRDLDDAFATICLNEDVEFPPGDAECPDPKPAWKALEGFWTKFEKLLPANVDPDTTCRLQQAAREYERKLRIARKRLDRPAVIADLLSDWDCDSKITLYQWAAAKAEQHRIRDVVVALHRDFRSGTVEPYLNSWRHYVYKLSVTLLTRAREYASDERRRRNALNYGDLLNLTAKVLRENRDVRRALQRKYHFLFVDEFQDTDPVQAEIVFLLAADEALRPADGIATWRRVPLRPGALFVVGDPKQSIYRFRRADIEIYNTVRDRLSDRSAGRVVPLTTNFRSVPALCEWANRAFDGPFPAEPTRHSPRFGRLDPDKKRRGLGGVFTLTYGGDAKEVPAEDADRIARYIRSEVDTGRRTFSDFLILTRKKKDRIEPYASALEALNVPLEVSGAGAFGQSAEVQTLTTLMRVLADPLDPLPLVNVLRGPLFGISDPELFEFKQAGGWFSIFHDPEEALAKAGKSPAAVVAALASLRQYHRWVRLLPAGAALDKILEHTGYLSLAATSPGGVEAGDLLHAVDRVRQVMEEGGSLDQAADALEADSEFTNEVESLPLEPGRTDVVRLMNLHKAKGLEASVVFLADPCGGIKPGRVDVHVERTGDRALGWFKIEKKSESSFAAKLLGEHADWEMHEQAELPYLEAEETRLLYVAATRARDMVVVSRHVGGNGRGTPAWGLLNNALADANELRVPASVNVVPLAALVCSTEAQAEANAARVAADARVNQPSWSITSVTAESKQLARLVAAEEPLAPDDATRVVAQNTPSHRADAGMAWGTLIHGLLEHAMGHPNATRDDLRRLAMWLTVEEPRLRAVLDEALDTVEGVSRAEFWRAAKSSEHYEEAPFAMIEGDRVLTNGVIDLVFKSAEGWQVRDYKTTVSLDPSVHRQQLETYRSALAKVGCEQVAAEIVPVRKEPA